MNFQLWSPPTNLLHFRSYDFKCKILCGRAGLGSVCCYFVRLSAHSRISWGHCETSVLRFGLTCTAFHLSCWSLCPDRPQQLCYCMPSKLRFLYSWRLLTPLQSWMPSPSKLNSDGLFLKSYDLHLCPPQEALSAKFFYPVQCLCRTSSLSFRTSKSFGSYLFRILLQ